MKLKNIKHLVVNLLTTSEKARNSDLELIRMVFRFYGLPTDINQLPDEYGSIFETVRRTRQKVQEQYPNLKACKEVQEARAQKEAEYHLFALEG